MSVASLGNRPTRSAAWPLICVLPSSWMYRTSSYRRFCRSTSSCRAGAATGPSPFFPQQTVAPQRIAGRPTTIGGLRCRAVLHQALTAIGSDGIAIAILFVACVFPHWNDAQASIHLFNEERTDDELKELSSRRRRGQPSRAQPERAGWPGGSEGRY